MDKFGRNYFLEIQPDPATTIVITLPFTIEFDITRNTLSSANVCQIRIYNLSLQNRNLIRYNSFEYSTFKAVQLRAGYGNNLATLFAGNISQAWSVREGVNFITQIECYDGGFAFNNGQTNAQFPSGTPYKTVIQELVASLPEVKTGAIGNYSGFLSRGNTYSGNTTEILTQLTNGGFFIDNGKANALQTNEYIQSLTGPTKIDASTGLLGTPVLERSIVRFDMLFEPSLNVGYQVFLQSTTSDQHFNGYYTITGVKHRGMISESVCGTVTTSGEFLAFKEGSGVFSQNG